MHDPIPTYIGPERRDVARLRAFGTTDRREATEAEARDLMRQRDQPNRRRGPEDRRREPREIPEPAGVIVGLDATAQLALAELWRQRDTVRRALVDRRHDVRADPDLAPDERDERLRPVEAAIGALDRAGVAGGGHLV